MQAIRPQEPQDSEFEVVFALEFGRMSLPILFQLLFIAVGG